MQTYTLPHTDLQISHLAYGCMQIGGSWDRAAPITAEQQKAALKVLRAALELGINFFDHADIYCAGKSETVFAALWHEAPNLRQQVIVQTKCGIRFGGDPTPAHPHRFDFSYDHLLQSAEGSLRRLQTDYLDLFLLHRPDALVEPEEVARAFDALHAAGKVRYFGVSNHNAAQLALLQKYVRQPLVVNQLEFSLLHLPLVEAGIITNQAQPPEVVRGEGTLEYCRQHNILIQAWAPLAGGAVLTGQGLHPHAAATAALVKELARAKNVSPEAIALAWILRHPAYMQPVVGTTQPARLRAAAAADGITLTREEWYQLFTAARGIPLP